MSHRRTSLSFAVGLLPLLFLFDCQPVSRDWEGGVSEGGRSSSGGGSAQSSLGGSGTGGSHSGSHSGGSVVSGSEGGGSSSVGGSESVGGQSQGAGGETQQDSGGSSSSDGGRTNLGGATSGGNATGGSTSSQLGGATSGGSAMGGSASGGTFTGTTGGCTSSIQCDDGNRCNGTETCDLALGQCVAGTNDVACSNMDARYCRCALVPGNICGVQGLDRDGDGDKTRLCVPDPGLDCDDSNRNITHNACGGCTNLTAAPGTNCGVCGGSQWTCISTEVVSCVTALPAPTRCGIGVTQVCRSGAWETQTTCIGLTPICVLDNNVPKCAACAIAGETRCKAGTTNVVQTCANDRLSWTDLTCPGAYACLSVAGKFQCALCSSGTSRCDPNDQMKIQVCNASGTGWDFSGECYLPSFCVESGGSAWCGAQLLPSELEELEIDFGLGAPKSRVYSSDPSTLGAQEFLDLASGFALA